MNPRRVNAAAGVIHGSQVAGKRTATGLAADLEAACLLQSPETAAEQVELRTKVEELDFLHRTTLPELRREVEHHKDGKARWRKRAEAAEARVAELEQREAQWAAAERIVSEARDKGTDLIDTCLIADALGVGAEADGITRRIAPTQALREDVPPLRGRALLDALTVERAEKAHNQRLGIEEPHDSPLHHDYRLGRDQPQPDAAP
ncbi:hypothetical protein [Streptomyces sp. XY006]|uniref:hypothetical protein n=1 Tax=Streptomyces sp. XY006 TaxID=2021410 RepID=UPI000B8BE9B1|nr:hypothetical protein [Streptomyces sp. XY006]OXS35437.1 hypothetical protein CHR28_10540 [Streptomyces sp. XY006]